MAGGKRTRNALATLDTMPERVWAMVDEGKSLRKMAAELATEGVETSKTYLHEWLSRDEASKARWKAACRARAWDLMEEAAEIADSARPDTVSQDRLKIDQRNRMSEVMDRETFGKGPQIAVQINVADAFIQAMREKA
jgi:hypothetical protein